MSEQSASAGIFSCVVDADPRFHLEASRWFAALTRAAGVDPSDLVLHVVDGCSSEVVEHLQAQGASVRSIETFDDRSPHCNKIAAALSLASTGVAGVAVLTDTDVMVLEDPRRLDVPERAVALKPVDAPLPPVPVLKAVFAAAGLPVPPAVPLQWRSDQLTLAGNGNGGLYLIPGHLLPAISDAWAQWASWLLEHIELLGPWATQPHPRPARTAFVSKLQAHVDQVAMALAIAATASDAWQLDVRWNFPTHVPANIPDDAPAPAVIHYHQSVSATGLLLRTGVPQVDARIESANSVVTDAWRAAFPNDSFWEWRYRTNPELGSGVGSRGKPLEDKRALLSTVVEVLRPVSVLDVGCGDGEATRGLPLGSYIGLDVSPEALRRARIVRPSGDFRLGTLSDHSLEADLTVCLDVLIHQSDADAYETLVGQLLASADRALLVSGYDEPPNSSSPMIGFHEPLSRTLARLAPDAELHPLRNEHEITTFLLLKGLGRKHPRDHSSQTLSTVRSVEELSSR